MWTNQGYGCWNYSCTVDLAKIRLNKQILSNLLKLHVRNVRGDDCMHEPIPKEDMFILEQQKVVLEDFESSGYILDIGGGGEGTIGILKGDTVIAIDTRKGELEEAPEGPLKIVMDARDLQFLDNTFETVTSLFTLMFVKRADRKKVVEEVYRVLKPGGKFLIWDVVIPLKGNNDKVWFVIPLEATVRNEKIETAYGVGWEGREQDVSYLVGLAGEIGFNVVEKEEHDQVFFLELIK